MLSPVDHWLNNWELVIELSFLYLEHQVVLISLDIIGYISHDNFCIDGSLRVILINEKFSSLEEVLLKHDLEAL
jgi:hypothetical protein